MPGSGVPLRRPAADNVTPAGNVPAVTLTVGAGKPVITTLNEPALPTVKVVLFALVIAGAALTTTVKACVAFGSVPLVAVSVTGKDPLCVGVPDSSPAADSVRPVGSTPLVTLTVGAGMPVITTWNVVPAVFSTNVAVLALVIDRRLVDRQREGLHRVGADAVGRGERHVVGAAGARVGRPAQQAGGVNVTPAGNVPAVTLTVGAGKPVITTLNEPALPTVKVGCGGARDRRRRVDRRR